MIVVVVLVLAKHGCGMPLVDDQDAVEESWQLLVCLRLLWQLSCRYLGEPKLSRLMLPRLRLPRLALLRPARP
jgi:hypothetical protein